MTIVMDHVYVRVVPYRFKLYLMYRMVKRIHVLNTNVPIFQE